MFTNLRLGSVRHGFTDDSPRIAEWSGMTEYGRSMYNTVDTAIADGTTSTSFDTHSCSLGMTFSNIKGVNTESPVVGLRGRKHFVTGVFGDVGRILVQIFSEDGTDTDSWGHVVDGGHGNDMADNLLRVRLNTSSFAKETRPSYIRNLSGDGIKKTALYIQNATLVFDGAMDSRFANDFAAADNLDMVVSNSDIRFENLELDYTAVKTDSVINHTAIRTDYTSTVRIDRLRVLFGGSSPAARCVALFAELGSGISQTAPYKPLVDMLEVIWETIITNDTVTGLVDMELNAVEGLGEVEDPSGNKYWGALFSLRCLEYAQ